MSNSISFDEWSKQFDFKDNIWLRSYMLVVWDAVTKIERDACASALAAARIEGVRLGIEAAASVTHHWQNDPSYTAAAQRLAYVIESNIKRIDPGQHQRAGGEGRRVSEIESRSVKTSQAD